MYIDDVYMCAGTYKEVLLWFCFSSNYLKDDVDYTEINVSTNVVCK